jgi:integrase
MPKRRGRGEGSIFKRGGRYVGEVTVGTDPTGKRIRRTVYGETYSQVQRQVRELLDQRPEGTVEDVEGVANRWLQDVGQRLAPSTVRRYTELTRDLILPGLGARQLLSLKPADILAWQQAVPGSVDAAHKASAVLRRILRYAVRLGLLNASPAAGIGLPRPDRKRISPLDPLQVRRFLEATRGLRWHALFALALDSGLRQGELLALQWEDLDAATGRLRVYKNLSEVAGRLTVRQPKTKAGRRTVLLAPETVAKLVAHRVDSLFCSPTDLMFCTRDGYHIRKSNFLRGGFVPALRKAGLPRIRFHDLRHTCATLLLTAGVHPKVVQERLGHARIEVTLDTYSHVMPTLQENAASSLGKALYG